MVLSWAPLPGWDSLSRARHRSSRRSISGGMRAVMSTNSALSGVRGMSIRIRLTSIDSNHRYMRMYTVAYVFEGGNSWADWFWTAESLGTVAQATGKRRRVAAAAGRPIESRERATEVPRFRPRGTLH